MYNICPTLFTAASFSTARGF